MRRFAWTLLALAACASTSPSADVPQVPLPDASLTDAVDASVTDVVDASVIDVVDASVIDVVDASVTDVVDAADVPSACGRPGARLGRWYQTLTSRGITRQFYVSVPANYDPSRRYPLVVGLHGRDYDGVRMRDYLALESQPPNDWAIFVYPDALQRTWGTLQATGWQNGPVASMTSAFGGTDDLAFIDDMLAWMRDAYCLDPTRVFATGQSWGGDFSNVVGCFRGDVFRAVAPVAANGDYYLPTRSDAAAPCVGAPAVWALHGINDTSIPFAQGGRYRDFWVRRHGCDPAGTTPLTFAGAMSDDSCVAYRGCAQPVRWCAYNAAAGHQIPRAYYPREVVAWFRSI